MPYLSALLRIADEIDVTASRNCLVDYDLKHLKDNDLLEFMKHEAVQDLIIEDKAFVMVVHTEDEELFKTLIEVSKKMQATLDQCRHAVNGRTKFKINQEKILIKRI